MSEAELYRKAADSLQRNGWCQQRFHKGDAACLLGALCDIEISHKVHGTPLTQLYCVAGGDIVHFNDHDCETVDDAVAALLIAADLATPAPEQS